MLTQPIMLELEHMASIKLVKTQAISLMGLSIVEKAYRAHEKAS